MENMHQEQTIYWLHYRHITGLTRDATQLVNGREHVWSVDEEKPSHVNSLWLPLLLARIETSLRAFPKTAIDFAGPIVTVPGRGKRRQKRHLCLFSCMTTRAVHLELAFGLDKDSFMKAFYKMVIREGYQKKCFLIMVLVSTEPITS